MGGDDYGRLVYLALILVSVLGWGFVEHRGKMGQGLRTLAAWALIFVGVMAGYGIWQDIRPDLPQQATITGDEIRIPRDAAGHYNVLVRVNGQDIPFMIDTGATNIVLTQDDARRVGLNPDELAFIGEARTANGVTRIAPVRLDLMTLGPFNDSDLRAWVNEGELSQSLLGMDYLGRFRIEIDGGVMVLRR